MPDFMLALVDLHKNWNDYADANETIKQFIIDRQDNRRRSASTNNPESNSTRIILENAVETYCKRKIVESAGF